MTIHKCDICGKKIENENSAVGIGNRGFFAKFILCNGCGKPIVDFMMKNKLINKK